MRRICVFCGSSSGNDPSFLLAADNFGQALAKNGIGLVYGGASVGLMGALADSVIRHGGEVTGVIPEAMVHKEVAHLGLSELRIVTSMHERKALMSEMSDAFVALPGGIGTLEELFEVWTWAQLGYHSKPCSLYNVGGYYDVLISFLSNLVKAGFLKPVHLQMLVIANTPEEVLANLRAYIPSAAPKWVRADDR